VTAWDGDEYQRRFDRLAAAGTDVHGEAAFVMRYQPVTVLDAGCGTGRVAIELAQRGVEVVGVDLDASMLSTARRLGPTVEWCEADLATLKMEQTFDVVVMAGNVLLFTVVGKQASVVASCARHLSPKGVLVSGFQLGRGYGLDEYDDACTAAGLSLQERYATWDRDPFTAQENYAVSVHGTTREKRLA
jgi:2-polyprenyl-3-methyl-5-hydroxy-6-metoxy-1,4-benzoquinol methylase